MKSFFHVTYSIVTPESAELRDTAENGYARPWGWRFPVETMNDADVDACAMTLREALTIFTPSGESGSGWFYGESETLSYRDGSDISYCLHPPRNITPSSYNRLTRILGV